MSSPWRLCASPASTSSQTRWLMGCGNAQHKPPHVTAWHTRSRSVSLIASSCFSIFSTTCQARRVQSLRGLSHWPRVDGPVKIFRQSVNSGGMKKASSGDGCRARQAREEVKEILACVSARAAAQTRRSLQRQVFVQRSRHQATGPEILKKGNLASWQWRVSLTCRVTFSA